MFVDNTTTNGEELFKLMNLETFITKPAERAAVLPSFNLPYYEGLNRHNNKYWLGIYRRDELFRIDFLKELCLLCLDTKIGQLCSSPWKSIIIKSIEEKDRPKWNRLLEKYQVNMRHAANELNFQVEDSCEEGLQLRNFLVKKLNDEDTRTFGICIGIKTRRKSEVFSSILVRKKSLLRIFGKDFFSLYDILCAHDFNPNERTGFVFSSNNPKFLLAEQLRRSIVAFYNYRSSITKSPERVITPKKQILSKPIKELVHQCSHCLTIYDAALGQPESGIIAGILFTDLPKNYCCPLCEASKEDFKLIPKSNLGLQTI